ncbi:hypothetical protein D3C76_1140110 [compost metagenome]
MVTLFNCQTCASGKLAQGFRCAVTLQVFRRRAQNALVLRQLAGNQIGGNVITDADIQVKTFADQIHQPIGNVQPQFKRRVFQRQRRQCRADKTPTEAETADNTQRTLRCLTGVGKLIHHLIDVVQNALCPLVNALAIFGDRHPARSTVQQRHVQRLFQQRNTFADECR